MPSAPTATPSTTSSPASSSAERRSASTPSASPRPSRSPASTWETTSDRPPSTAAGAKLITSSWQRPDNLCGPAGAKVNGSYVASTLAKREAVRQGANEAVMLNSVGHVAECTGENIFMYRHGKIITPSVAESILEGITRDSIIKVARDMGYEVDECPVSRFMLMSSEEVWMTGTAAEIAPVTMIDGKPVGDGKISEVATKIHNKFRDIATGKDPQYESWLYYVN